MEAGSEQNWTRKGRNVAGKAVGEGGSSGARFCFLWQESLHPLSLLRLAQVKLLIQDHGDPLQSRGLF